MITDDMELVREYAATHSEAAFETLVVRHLSLVHSAALRQVRDPHLAEEITQTVFTILARKAGSLSPKTILPGWLYRTTRYVASAALKIQLRRQRREQEAHMQSMIEKTHPDAAWEKLAPLLDDAMAQLREQDRDAIVLRYFQNKSLRDVGVALGVDEYAAQKRVVRALDKLRGIFVKRGAASTTAVIAGLLAAHSVQAAPTAMVKSVSAIAITQGATASGSTLTLIKGALKLMAWTKVKTAAVVGAGILLGVGTTTVAIKEIRIRHIPPWQVSNFDSRVLDRQLPQVKILPSKIRNGSWGSGEYGKMMGTGVDAGNIVMCAYDWMYKTRTIIDEGVKEPPGRYDYIASLPSGNTEALQKEVKRKFGFVAHRETVETNVWLLQMRRANAPGLKPVQNQNGSSTSSNVGHLRCDGGTLDNFARNLEEYVKQPILDRTGINEHFDIDFTWRQKNWNDTNVAAVNEALLSELGLELVPSREPVEMLVVEKEK